MTQSPKNIFLSHFPVFRTISQPKHSGYLQVSYSEKLYICKVSKVIFNSYPEPESTSMKKYIFCFISILYTYATLWAAADTPDIVPFRYDPEFNSGNITSVTQDTTGQLWITTQEHLYRFDGYRVDKIELQPHRSITVQSELQNVFGDSKNCIWIGSGSCIYCYDQNHKTTRHYFPVPEDILNMSNVVYQIAEAPDGTIYFGTRNGIFNFDETGKTLKRFEGFPWHKVCSSYKKEERLVISLHITPDGILWGGTIGDGIWRINLKDGKKIHFKHQQDDPASLGGNIINTIYEDSFGAIWIGTENGVSVFRKETSTFTNIIPGNISTAIYAISETGNGDLLLGSGNGMYVHNRRTQANRKIDIPAYPNLLSYSNHISILKRDRSGGVWIGTPKGLACGHTAHNFTLFKHSDTDPNSIASNTVSFLKTVPQTSSLWITYNNGDADYYNPAKKTFKHYSPAKAGKQYATLLSTYFTPKGEFLIGTTGGLLRFNPKRDKFEPLEFPFSGQSFSNTYAILQDHREQYWLGVLDSGIFRVNPQHESCERIPISYEKVQKNIYTNIKILYEDRQRYIWIVFYRAGILRYNPETGEERLFTRENTNGLLPNNAIWDVKEDVQGRLILATAGGLAIWNPQTEKFIECSATQSVSGEYIIGMEENPTDTTWWLSTTKGIIRLNPSTGNTIHYTEADGLQGYSFKNQAIARIDSLFFFGGNYGLNSINANKSIENTHIPTPQLTRIIINGIETDPDLLPVKNGLPYLKLKREDIAEIFFSSFSYRKEWRNYYKTGFRHGNHHVWQHPRQKNSVTFTAGQSGITAFSLTASNSDGIWSSPRALLLIDVDTPYLALLSIAALLLAISGIVFYYRKAIRKKIERRPHHSVLKPQVSNQTIQLQEKFKALMDEKRLYLNKRFSKTELAARLKLNEQQLTLFLKNGYGKSFPEIINHYRVEAVKQKMEEPQYKDYTLFALGEECGFNSRSSFYRVFKEYTGQTPAEYLENPGAH